MNSRIRTASGAIVELKADEQLWLRRKWAKIRTSQGKADSASNSWNELNDAVNVYLDQSGIMDPVQRAEIKGKNLGLKDALATHKWHAEEAQRHIDDVNLFLRLKEMGAL